MHTTQRLFLPKSEHEPTRPPSQTNSPASENQHTEIFFLQSHSPNLELTSGQPCAIPECQEFQIQAQTDLNKHLIFHP